jgi:hypothetical protein
MIEKQKNSFWRTLDGIDTFKVDASQIPLELVEQLPPELLVRNSKKEYFRLIIWTAGLYLVFVAVALLWKRPFIEAYEASPFWSVALALFPLNRIILCEEQFQCWHRQRPCHWFVVHILTVTCHFEEIHN